MTLESNETLVVCREFRPPNWYVWLEVHDKEGKLLSKSKKREWK